MSEVTSNVDNPSNSKTDSTGNRNECENSEKESGKVEDKRTNDPTKANQDEPEEEWKRQLLHLKDLGDTSFRNKSFSEAITHYSSALALDPNHHILLSNRSAAYLSNNEKSKALSDARKCVEICSSTTSSNSNTKEGSCGFLQKAYSRVAAALMSLRRYKEASGYYEKMLKNNDKNDTSAKNDKMLIAAKKSLDECKLQIKRQLDWEKQQIELQMKQQEESQSKSTKESNDEQEPQSASTKDSDEDDDMDDFFSEVNDAVEQVNKPPVIAPVSQPKPIISLSNDDLKTSEYQINRLLTNNYQWKNLNPFYVLQITNQDAVSLFPSDNSKQKTKKEALSPLTAASGEEENNDQQGGTAEQRNPHSSTSAEMMISKRYRALSLLIHPDKNLENQEKAKLAFDEAKKAMDMLRDENKRRHCVSLIEQGMKIGRRKAQQQFKESSKKQPIDKGRKEEEEQKKIQDIEVIKIFAEVEYTRREVEKRKLKQENRERAQEDEENTKLRREMNFEKKWKDKNRVNKRVGNWRDFSSSKKNKQNNDS